MTRDIHQHLLEAWASGRYDSKAEMARDLGMPSATLKDWLRAGLGEKQYREHERDAKLRDVLGIGASAPRGDGASGPPVVPELPDGRKAWPGYGGPADLPDDSGSSAPSSPAISGATKRDEFDAQAAIEEQARRYRKKHRRAQAKKQQTIRFPHGPICLFLVGDQHIGNGGTDIERIFGEQEIMMDTPGGYVWQMGDVVDNFIVGRLKKQNMKPSAPVWEQWQLARHYLQGFGDRLVAFVGGNHGAWTMQQTSIDYRRDLCPDGILYDGDEVKATVSVGNAQLRIWARHQWQGSSIYNQTHGMERAARFSDPGFDVYVGAHLHTGAVWRGFIHEGERKAAVQLGAYKRHDDFAKRCGFPDSDGSTACAMIIHDDGSFHGMADIKAAQRYMQAVYA